MSNSFKSKRVSCFCNGVSEPNKGRKEDTARMTEEEVLRDHRIPLKKEQLLNGAGRAINCLAWDKSGARVISGSSDHIVRMYDFGGMTAEHDPFQWRLACLHHRVASLPSLKDSPCSA